MIQGISCAGKETASENKAKDNMTDTRHNNDSNRIIIKFKPGTDDGTIKNIQKKSGLVKIKNINNSGLFLMKIDGNRPAETVISDLKRLDEVLYVEPEHKYHLNNK